MVHTYVVGLTQQQRKAHAPVHWSHQHPGGGAAAASVFGTTLDSSLSPNFSTRRTICESPFLSSALASRPLIRSAVG